MERILLVSPLRNLPFVADASDDDEGLASWEEIWKIIVFFFFAFYEKQELLS